MMNPDLWVGADVRWRGPETVRTGVHLKPGDRAIVVDAGRHHVTSFTTLHAPKSTTRPRSGRGVTIRLVEGGEVVVARKHLELVPPGHPLAPEPDGAQAAWWLDQLDPWGRGGIAVSTLVPSSFAAVGQVLHPWWGAEPNPISWRAAASRLGFATVAAFDQTRDLFTIPAAQDAGLSAADGELDTFTAEALIDVLAGATTTPDDVFVAVWEGWGDAPPQRFPGAARLDTEARGHFLLRGPLTGPLTSVAVSGFDRPAAGLWWPADRAWFVATEIDFEWTFVAGNTALLDALLADERLEVAPTTFDAAANRAAEPT